jgi:MFS family permease
MDRALFNPLHDGPGVEEDSSNETAAKSAQRVLRNFHVLAAAFSLNHGCVTALVALAASDLGSSLGNTTLFILYAFYTLSAAFLSNGLVARAGAKRTLVLSLGAYCVYVASYAVAFFTPIDNVVIVGAAVGGVAAGCLWPAQGVFFARSAEAYADAASISQKAATALLGAHFSAAYLAGEVGMKLLASAFVPGGPLFVAYSCIAVGATLAVQALVEDVQSVATAPPFAESATAALRLFRRSALCRLLVPTNLAFGLAAAYLNGWLLSAVVGEFLGERAVGAVSAVVVASAALLALPLGRLGRSLGTQRPVVALGGACFGFFGVATLIFSRESLGCWAAAVALAVVFGAGRATWEGNFKSSVADDFHDATTAAFANVTVQSGLASTLGFLLNRSMSPRAVAMIVVASSVAAIASQAAAAKIRSEPRTTYAATDVV